MPFKTVEVDGRRCCVDCKNWLPIESFIKRSGGRYRNSVCRACGTLRSTVWVAQNRQRFNDYQRSYLTRKRDASGVRPRRNRRPPEPVWLTEAREQGLIVDLGRASS